MNQMGTIDTWISSCTPGQSLLCSVGVRHLCLVPSFPLPSLLSAPCLAPCAFGEHSRAAWPGVALVNPSFDPHLAEVSQKSQAPPGQFVCALSSLEMWDAQSTGRSSGIAPSCRRSFPCTWGHRGAHGQLSLRCFHIHFLPLCVLITENPRLVWAWGKLKAHLVQPPLMSVSVLQFIPIPSGSSLLI